MVVPREVRLELVLCAALSMLAWPCSGATRFGWQDGAVHPMAAGLDWTADRVRMLRKMPSPSAEDIADAGFFAMGDAQPRGPDGAPGRDPWRKVVHAVGEAYRKQQMGMMGTLGETQDGGESLSSAQVAFLFDDVFFSGGVHKRERDIAPAARHKPEDEGENDDVTWEALATPWDELKGIRMRNHHGQSTVEKEIETIFRDQGGVLQVREKIQTTLLRMGRSDPDSWTAWNQLGNTFRVTGEVHRAIQCFRRALFLNPNEPDVLLNLAVLMQNLGFVEDAEVLIRQALEVNPEGVLHNFIYGNILFEMGRIHDAIQAFRNSIRTQPKFLPALKRLQDLGVETNDDDDSNHGRTAASKKELAGNNVERGKSSSSKFDSEEDQRAAEAEESVEVSFLLYSHFLGLFLLLLATATALGCTEELDLLSDDEGTKAKKKVGNRKKAKRRAL